MLQQTPIFNPLKSAEGSWYDCYNTKTTTTWITKESKPFSEPSESYLPSYRSSELSTDDLALIDVTKVCQNGPMITARNRVVIGDLKT